MRTLFFAILGLAILTPPAAAHSWVGCNNSGTVVYYVGDTLPAPNSPLWTSVPSFGACSPINTTYMLTKVVTPVGPNGSTGALNMIAGLQRLQSLPTASKAVVDTQRPSQNRIETIRVNPASFAPAVRKVLFPTP